MVVNSFDEKMSLPLDQTLQGTFFMVMDTETTLTWATLS